MFSPLFRLAFLCLFFFVAVQSALPDSVLQQRNQEIVSVLTQRSDLALRAAAPSSSGDLANCTQTQTCAKKGGKCDSDALSGCHNATNSLCCALGLYCTAGTCQTDNLGAGCSKTSDCYPTQDGTHIAYCVNNTCTEIYNTNDYCESDDVCLSGTCQDGRCQGNAVGKTCDYTMNLFGQTCAIGAYCNLLGFCSAASGSGQGCVAGIPPCAPGLTCVSNKCQSMFSIPEGSACDGSTNSFECTESAVCNNLKCLTGSGTYVPEECSQDSDCTSNSCRCSPYLGKGVCDMPATATNCQSELSNLYSCMTKNNCSYSSNEFTLLVLPIGSFPNNAPNSCTIRNCKSEFIADRICECIENKLVEGNCYYEYYCSKLATWIIIVLIIAGVVLIGLVCICVFICCRCCRRRRGGYDRV